MDGAQSLVNLLGEARALLAEVDDDMAQRFVRILGDAVAPAPSVKPAPFPLAALPSFGALANERTQRAAEALDAAATAIEWWQSDRERVPPGWVHLSAATELVGPDGNISSGGDDRFGIFYLSPGLDYPNHWHNAEEFYLVLGGNATWTIDGVTTTETAGNYVRTPSLAHHRIVTADEPMLAFWAWAGDTSFDSYAY